jgi:hypothetical protein
VRLEHVCFEAYNECETLIEVVTRFHERMGFWPERVLADKIYRNKDNLAFCTAKGIRMPGPPLGRPPQKPTYTKKVKKQDNADRIEVERAFSHSKRQSGLGCIRAKLLTTSRTAIALSVLALNLAKIWHPYFFWWVWRSLFSPHIRFA